MNQATTGQPAAVTVVIVRVGEERAAIRLADVREVLPALAWVPLPGAPAMVTGVFNLHGTPVPLLSLRERVGLPDAPADPHNHVVLCQIAGRQVGLWVDVVDTVAVIDRDEVVPADGVAATRHLDGVAVLDDGLLFVYDVRAFLEGDDALRLDAAMAAAGTGGPDES